MFFEKALDKLKGRVALADGGALIAKRGLVDGPGGYAGKKFKYSNKTGKVTLGKNKGKWFFDPPSGSREFFNTKKELNSYLKKRSEGSFRKTPAGKKFLTNEKFKNLYKEFSGGSDSKFADYIEEKGYTNQAGKKYSINAIESRRKLLGLKSKAPKPMTIKEFKTKAKEFNIDTKGLSSQQIKNKVYNKIGAEVRKQKKIDDPVYREQQRKAVQKRMKQIKKDPVRLKQFKDRVRAYNQSRIFGLAPVEGTPKGLLYRDLIANALRHQSGELTNSHIQFLNKKQKIPTSISKTNEIKLIDTNVIDPKTGKPKIITYNNILKHIDDNKKLYNTDSKKTLREYEKKRFIQNNKDLRDQLNRKIYSSYDPRDATKRKVSPFHIHHTAGRAQNAFNVQLAIAPDNMAEGALRRRFDTDFKAAKTFNEKKELTKNFLKNVSPTIEVRLKRKPYGERPLFIDQLKGIGAKLNAEQRAQAIKLRTQGIGPALIADPILAQMAEGDPFIESLIKTVTFGQLSPLKGIAEERAGLYDTEKLAIQRQKNLDLLRNRIGDTSRQEMLGMKDPEYKTLGPGKPSYLDFLIQKMEQPDYVGSLTSGEQKIKTKTDELRKKIMTPEKTEKAKTRYDAYQRIFPISPVLTNIIQAATTGEKVNPYQKTLEQIQGPTYDPNQVYKKGGIVALDEYKELRKKYGP